MATPIHGTELEVTAANLAPIAPNERITLLDAIRAFALLGILLMNMEAFNGPLLLSASGMDPALTGVDRVVDGLIYFFVQGKFFTLFSLLFGMGFAVIVQRAEAAGRPFALLYLRRSVALLVIGLAHALLVWSGDVLVTYALLSFLLLAFQPVPARWLAWLGGAAYLAAPAMMFGIALIAGLMSLSPESAASWDAAIAQGTAEVRAILDDASRIYAAGSYAEALQLRVREFGIMVNNIFLFGPMVLGMFLLGAALVRSGAITQPASRPRLFAFLRWGALPLGLLAMGASFALESHTPVDRLDFRSGSAQAVGMLGSGLMCLGYLGWLVAFFQGPGARLGAWLAPAGRMALTNYLMQSVVCTLVFYGYGLGWYGQLPRAWHVPFALVLFVLQVLLAHVWLARFRFGPMEWLWRSATYLRPQPMRLRAQPVAG